MERIRIGNDIAISWALFENNGATHLINAGGASVSLNCGGYTHLVPSFSVQGNVVSFIFPAEDQVKTGKYKIVLTERNESGLVSSYDVRDAFVLVPENEMLNVGYTQQKNVEITSVITHAAIANIKTISIVESEEEGGNNVVTFVLTDGSQFPMTVKNGSKGDKGDKGDQGIQGEKGDKGDTGARGPAGIDSVEASIGTNDPTQAPSVDKDLTEGVLSLTFNNIKGAKGDQGEPAVAVENYVTVEATPSTTSATDVLPATGSADTVYRVSNWDGTQYNTNAYTEYGWYNGTYKPLASRTPGIDDEPTANSQKLVKSGGVAAQISQLGQNVDLQLNGIVFKSENGNNIPNAGYVAYNTGELAVGGYSTTDFIRVEQGYKIILNRYGSSSVAIISAYSSQDESDYMQSASIAGSSEDGATITYNVPNGVSFVRLSRANLYADSFKAFIYSGDAINDKLQALTSDNEINKINIEINESELNNKQISEFNLNRWIKYSDGTIGGGGYGGVDLNVYEGQRIDIIGFKGSASVALIAFYDSSNNYMQSASLAGGSGTFTKSLYVPNGAVLCKLSCGNPETAKYVVSSNVVKQAQADDIILSTPYIRSLISVDELNDNKGFINASGNVDLSSTLWRYAYKLPVLPKMKLFLSKISSNGTSVTALALYDKEGNLLGREYSSQNANQLNLEYVIPDGAYYISFSLSGTASSNFRYDKMTDGKPIEQVIKDTLSKKDIMPIVLPRIAKPIPISFQFDDNHVNTDRTIHNLFASYNKPCNWAFIASDTDVEDVDLVTEYKIWQMKYGDGIMSHSINGTPFNTTNYTYETALAAISKAMENLEKVGLAVNGFVAPSSEMASEFMPILRLFHAYAFTSAAGDSTYNIQSSDLENLHRYSIESHSLQEIKDYIDACITNSAMPVFYGHSANLGNTYYGTYDGSAWSEEFNIAKITSILEYALSKENTGLAYVTNTDYAVKQFFGL